MDILKYDLGRKPLPDILSDYRQWRSQQEERIGTHSDDCHMWPRHERCMIHRLAQEVERLKTEVRRLLAALGDMDGATAHQDCTLTAEKLACETSVSIGLTDPTAKR